MSLEKFAVLLVEHRIWGLMLQPAMLSKCDKSSFYGIKENLFISDLEAYSELSFEEKRLIELSNDFSEANLKKLFSKENTVKEFISKLEYTRLENHIRPYIERKMIQMLEIIKEAEIPFYHKDKQLNNLYVEDKLNIEEEWANPLFVFERRETDLTYSLQLRHKERKIALKTSHSFIVSHLPAVVRIDKTLYFVNDIEGVKLKPFLSKDKIVVPKSAEKKYFESFILNTIKNYSVENIGFDISVLKPELKVELHLEENVLKEPALIMKFDYGQKKIFSSNKTKSFVKLNCENNAYSYEVVARDFKFEKLQVKQMLNLGLLSKDNVNFVFAEEGDLYQRRYNLINWINNNYDSLNEFGYVISQRYFKETYYLKSYTLEVNPEFKRESFYISSKVLIGNREYTLSDFKRNIIHAIREFELPGGEIFIVPEEWIHKYKNLFDFAKTEKDQLIVHKQHFGIVKESIGSIDEDLFKKLETLKFNELIPLRELPENLNANLRLYQHQGYSWMLFLNENNFGGCLADDMGLGKTVQTIALLLKLKSEFEANANKLPIPDSDNFSQHTKERLTHLIVLPSSLIHNWYNEIQKFAPTLLVYKHIGHSRKKATQHFSEYDLILSSYHTVRQDIDLFATFHFNYVILDESQLIKNPFSQLYRAMNSLNSDHRMVLSGTPIENSLVDLWTQLNFVNNGLLGGLSFFKKEFVLPIEKRNNQEKEEKLQALIKPFILRRKKKEVAKELPEISEQIVYCNMSEDQKKYYEDQKKSIRKALFKHIDDEGIEKSSMHILNGMIRLRQIANHPALIDEAYLSDSGKYIEIMRNIENVISEGHKVLLFSSFVKHLNVFKQRFDEDGLNYSMLTGSTQNREQVVQNFQENEDVKIFLISLKAGGIGLNLTAADYVFVLDPWWNPASEMQAVDRTHRIGQDKNVFVYRFISNETIEEKIIKLQKQKAELAETFINTNNPFKYLNIEDVVEIFN